MLYRVVAVTAVVFVAPMLAGCGTAINAVWLIPEENGKRVYGGVRTDCEQIRGRHEQAGRLPVDRIEQLVYTLDVPLSAVGDTITLPYILAYDSGLFGRRFTNLGSAFYPDAIKRVPESGGVTLSPLSADQSR